MKGVRILSGVVVVLLLVTMFANSLWLLPAIDAINRGVSDLHLQIAEQARTSLLSSLAEVSDALNEAADLVGFRPQEAEETLSRFLKNNPSIEEASFISMGGFELVKVSRRQFIARSDLRSRKGEASFESIISGAADEYDGPVFFSPLAEPLIEVSVPVRSASGVIVGVLSVENNLRFVWDLMSNIRVGERGRVYVIDQNKNLIADPNPSIVLRGENLAYRAIVNKVASGRVADGLSADDSYVNFQGEQVFAVAIPVEKLGWGVIVEENLSDAFSSRRRLIVFAGIFLVVAFALLAILLWNIRSLVKLFRELDLEKRQTSAIVSNLTDGLVEYTEDFRIILMNPAAEQIMGVKAGDAVGRKFEPKDSTEEKLSSFARVLFPILVEDAKAVRSADERYKIIELKIHHPLERDLQVITVPILNEAGRIVSYLKVIRDVTREKAIARTKSEFISLAAHQLRTPLSAIKWTLRMIIDGDAGPVTPEAKNLLMTGFRSNDRMISLVNDLLDVARIEEGRFGYKFKLGDATEIINSLTASIMPFAKESGVELNFAPPPEALPEIVFDAEKFSLALNNLIDNSIRYSKHPGARVDIRAYVEGGFVRIDVEDNGIGIAEGHMPKLFSKFSRGPNAIKEYTEGSGLGLFIVKNIIKRHGGDVMVKSEEGRGSVFSLTLPLDPNQIPPVSEVYEDS